MARHFNKSVDPAQGLIKMAGLKEPVTVRRDSYGIPFIEAQTKEDLAFAIGYVNASDRLTQMTGMKLLSQGRLAEMAGPSVIHLDMYMRVMDLRKSVQNLSKRIRSENWVLLKRYADGVNAYMAQHRDNLPPGLALSGHIPERWTPYDSLSIFALINFGLSFNLHEEIAALSVLQKVGVEKIAWLMPVYPDEPLPFSEAEKLQGLDLQRHQVGLSALAGLYPILQTFGLRGVAASNNWAIGKSKTQGKASILANDQHLVLSMPSMYNLMHLRCRNFDVAGINAAGLPAIVAGYNGRIAWGMTMVMADNQDIFLEQIKNVNGRLHYLYQGQWLPASEREEVFRIQGQAPLTLSVYETVHGPLLNDVLSKEPLHTLQAKKLELPYGVALSRPVSIEDDDSYDAFFDLNKADSVDEAAAIIRRIRSIPLNLVFADKDNIAWQVTGTFPVRTKGRGLMPSPGWTGQYDWKGFLNAGALPGSINPDIGFIGTANHRTIAKDDPRVLSSSWYWPERAERISRMILATDQHTFRTSMNMQSDIQSPFVQKLQDTMLKGVLADDLIKEIGKWKDEKRRKKARLALDVLRSFDGNMNAESKGAALVSVFLDQVTKNIFLDELGPVGSDTWEAFCVLNNESYNATCDHLLMRGDESPFWDDIRTAPKESKAQILAGTLADTVDVLEKTFGPDPEEWRWGVLHTYMWETDTSKMAARMNIISRMALGALGSYFNRGPYFAPGDHFTLNVSNYMMGKDFDTWLIPSMRLIVDFSQAEPMLAALSSGQSDNPSSSHYDDGIKIWREGKYISFPFGDAAIQSQYRDILVLHPDGSVKP